MCQLARRESAPFWYAYLPEVRDALVLWTKGPEIVCAIMALCREAKMALRRQHRLCASMEAWQQQQPAAPSLLI